MSTSPSYCWCLAWLKFVQVCACCHCLCEFIFPSVLLCLKNTVPLALSTTSEFYSISASSSLILDLSGEGFGNSIPTRIECSKSLILCTLSLVRLYISCHLLQEEASLMRTEWCSDWQLQQYVIGNHFTAVFPYQNKSSRFAIRVHDLSNLGFLAALAVTGMDSISWRRPYI